MILYLFATLFEKRNRLIDKWHECGGKSKEILFKIRQVDMEILNNKEFFFGQSNNDLSRYTEHRMKKVTLDRYMPRNKAVHLQYAVR
jgi:hypothetical protein